MANSSVASSSMPKILRGSIAEALQNSSGPGPPEGTSSSASSARVTPVVLPEGFVCKITEAHIDEVMVHLNAGTALPKRLRKLEEAYGLGELRSMNRAHYESAMVQQHTETSAFALPQGLFATGQAVHHWWASWFKGAEKPPEQLKGKARPSWYDAQIVAALGVKRVKYAGHSFNEQTYQVH